MADYVVPVKTLVSNRPLPTHISLECLQSLLQSVNVSSPAPRVSQASQIPVEMQAAVPSVSANAVLQLFTRLSPSKKLVSPKLENLRSSVMRCFKKTIRVIMGGERNQYSIKKLPRSNEQFLENYERLKQLVEQHADLCREFSVARSGPQVDSHHHKSDFKTYNVAYLKTVFGVHAMRALFQCFVGILFCDCEPSSLSVRFDLQCCESNTHSKNCERKWKLLRRVLDEHLGVRLDDEKMRH